MKKEEKKIEINEKKGETKKTIITLVIGILIGAVITAAVFLIAKPKNNGRNIPDFSNFKKSGERPNMDKFDFSKEGRPSRNKDKENNKVEDKETKDATDEDKA